MSVLRWMLQCLYATNIVTSERNVNCLFFIFRPFQFLAIISVCLCVHKMQRIIDRNCAAKMNFHTFLCFCFMWLLLIVRELFGDSKYHFDVSSNKSAMPILSAIYAAVQPDYNFTYFSVYKRNVTHKILCIKIFSGDSEYFHIACFSISHFCCLHYFESEPSEKVAFIKWAHVCP